MTTLAWRIIRGSYLVAVLAAATSASAALPPASYSMLIGSKLSRFAHAPTFLSDGKVFISAAVLDVLSASSQQQAKQPAGGAAQPSEIATMRGPQTQEYNLAGHRLSINAAKGPIGGALDGEPLPDSVLREFQGRPYLSAEALANLGFSLSHDLVENLPRLCGKVTEIDYDASKSRLVITGLTPFTVRGEQLEDGITLEIEGALTATMAPREYDAGPVRRIGVKNLQGQGRCFVFIKQATRSGFRIRSEKEQGFATIDFGNYFQIAGAALTSSGEISLNVQLGAPVKAEAEMLENPPRLVLDFEGAKYEDATEYIEVNAGHCLRLRVGQPQPGHVRVVADLTQKLDYRLLTTDGGARYYCQLLPPLNIAAGGAKTGPREGMPAQSEMRVAPTRVRNRVVMLDAGHGGSDPGASGVLSGVNEKTLTLKMAKLAQAELEALGYTVLQTRGEDRFVSLGARTDYANTVLPYIFVSIHCNSIESPDFNGIMTFHHPAASAQSKQLAALVQQGLVSATGGTDKGVREANFFVLRETAMPSILIEAGFLTNKGECGLLCDPQYQRKIALAIASGVDRFVMGY